MTAFPTRAQALLADRNWSKLPVSRERHSGDGMFVGDVSHYLSCGQDALFNIALALMSANTGNPRRILDFACGFGRVARYLRAGFPDAEITFTDVMTEASAFCAATFDGRDQPICKDFAGYDPGRWFDLIVVGSLFTHLPADKSMRLLELLLGVTEPGGLIVLTSHGRYITERRASGKWPYGIDAEQYDAMITAAQQSGYGFVNYKGHADYGISLITFDWWMRAIARQGTTDKIELLSLRERGWARHQDVLAIRKTGA